MNITQAQADDVPTTRGKEGEGTQGRAEEEDDEAGRGENGDLGRWKAAPGLDDGGDSAVVSPPVVTSLFDAVTSDDQRSVLFAFLASSTTHFFDFIPGWVMVSEAQLDALLREGRTLLKTLAYLKQLNNHRFSVREPALADLAKAVASMRQR